MLCKNCNYILTGKENFCPNCAAPVKEKTFMTSEIREEEKPKENKQEALRQEYIFPKGKEEKNIPERDMRIFYDPHEREEVHREAKSKGYAGKIMLLLFLTCVFAVGTFAVADYFDITSSVFRFIGSASTTKQEEPVKDSFNHESSIVKPDISYTTVTAYVMSGEGLTLRKGPDNSYAPLEKLSDLTMVQIYGGSLAGEGWVYAYCPETGNYGWLDGSFLAKQESEETPLEGDTTAVSQEPTA